MNVLGIGRPHFVSLWDLMILLDPKLLREMMGLVETAKLVEAFPSGMNRVLEGAGLPRIQNVTVITDGVLLTEEEVADLVDRLKTAGFEDSADAVADLLKSDRFPRLRLDDAVREVGRRIGKEMKSKPLMIVSKDRIEHWDNPFWFGQDVYDAFYDAREDMKQAGNCYVADNNTACVFHSMRVAEHGLRELANRLQITQIGSTPIEFSEWGSIISKIRNELAERLKVVQGESRGEKKEAALKLYSDLNDQCSYFNDLWRKDVSHTRRHYNATEALNALTRVREFMQRLVQAPK